MIASRINISTALKGCFTTVRPRLGNFNSERTASFSVGCRPRIGWAENMSTSTPTIETGCRVVYVTVPDRDLGRKIASALVTEKLAACVNIIPGVESIYYWEEKVQQDPEELLIIKTTDEMMAKITARVKDLHTYDEPEVISMQVNGGSTTYISWLKRNTSA
jgi:periplasmic divalent cation tolerance protein